MMASSYFTLGHPSLASLTAAAQSTSPAYTASTAQQQPYQHIVIQHSLCPLTPPAISEPALTTPATTSLDVPRPLEAGTASAMEDELTSTLCHAPAVHRSTASSGVDATALLSQVVQRSRTRHGSDDIGGKNLTMASVSAAESADAVQMTEQPAESADDGRNPHTTALQAVDFCDCFVRLDTSEPVSREHVAPCTCHQTKPHRKPPRPGTHNRHASEALVSKPLATTQSRRPQHNKSLSETASANYVSFPAFEQFYAGSTTPVLS